MTHYLDLSPVDDEVVYALKYKTLSGAVTAGERELKSRGFAVHGYFAANRREGGKHIVAEWKDGKRILATVWV
jgi:hypothetical protein